jgi:hypothetical protein
MPSDRAFDFVECTALSNAVLLNQVWVMSRGVVTYRCEATTLEGFLQQLAVCYVGRGYWYYVSGFVPTDKDPRDIDAKLIKRYDIAMSKWTRFRRKQAGLAGIQYLRFRRYFLLLATEGSHRFYEDEPNVCDVRRVPITFSGYSVSSRCGRPHVRIAREEYLQIKAYFTEVACRLSVERLQAELSSLPFEPYAPIRSQYLALVRAVNHCREEAGLSTISRFSVRLKRRICRPFEPVAEATASVLTEESG